MKSADDVKQKKLKHPVALIVFLSFTILAVVAVFVVELKPSDHWVLYYPFQLNARVNHDYVGFVTSYELSRGECVNSSAGAEQQYLSCLAKEYKDYLSPELFTKQNEDDRSKLISVSALVIAKEASEEEFKIAEGIYYKWAIKKTE
jgi:hypothetical protein